MIGSLKIRNRRRRLSNGLALGYIGSALAIAVVALAVFGPVLSQGSSFSFVGSPFSAPTKAHILGTDVLGRDAFTRLLNGGYSILALSTLSTVLGVGLGALLGIIAGYRRDWLDESIMRILDVLLAFPQIILALVVLSILGSAPPLIILVVAAIHTPQVARVARAATLRTREEEYIRFAEMIGVSKLKIVLFELLPNIMTPLAIEFGLRLTFSIALIAGLNFVGMGLQPPAPDWGLMINEDRIGVATNPWPVAVPIVLISALTIGINLVMDSWLRRWSQGRTNEGAPLSLHGEHAVDMVAEELSEAEPSV
jgi:peptide/nickel transport system permease protein